MRDKHPRVVSHLNVKGALLKSQSPVRLGQFILIDFPMTDRTPIARSESLEIWGFDPRRLLLLRPPTRLDPESSCSANIDRTEVLSVLLVLLLVLLLLVVSLVLVSLVLLPRLVEATPSSPARRSWRLATTTIAATRLGG